MSLCLSFNPCRCPAGSLCWWRLPSIENFFHCNFRQKSKRSRSWAWKKREGSFRAWAASKGMVVALTAYAGSSGYDRCVDVDGWIRVWNLLFLSNRSSKYRQTTVEPRKFAKKLSDIRKAYMFKVELYRKLGWIFESQGLVCFVEQRDFDDPGINDLIMNEERLRISFGDPSGQKHVEGRCRDTHPADEVRTHGHILLFYRYRSSSPRLPSLPPPPPPPFEFETILQHSQHCAFNWHVSDVGMGFARSGSISRPWTGAYAERFWGGFTKSSWGSGGRCEPPPPPPPSRVGAEPRKILKLTLFRG